MDFTLLRDYLDHQKWTPYSETYVMQDHKVVFHHLAGFDDPETGARVKPNGFYHIYSCTKVLTVTAAMQLFERGELLMTDHVSAYLPEYADVCVRDPATGELRPPKRPMRLSDLFGMTSGLGYLSTWPALEELKKKTNGAAPTVLAMRSLATMPLYFDPGEKFQYSLSHDVLAAVVEVISGRRFGDYLREEILLPLGMTETGFSVPEGQEHRCVTPYKVDPETSQYTKMPFECHYQLGTEYESGGAGIITTPKDYILFADMLASGGTGASGARILSPATIDMMRTPLHSYPIFDYLENNGYRYGYGVRTMADPRLGNSPIGEFGWDGACGCYILADPKNKLSLYSARYVSPQHNFYHSPRLRNILYACL